MMKKLPYQLKQGLSLHVSPSYLYRGIIRNYCLNIQDLNRTRTIFFFNEKKEQIELKIYPYDTKSLFVELSTTGQKEEKEEGIRRKDVEFYNNIDRKRRERENRLREFRRQGQQPKEQPRQRWRRRTWRRQIRTWRKRS